MSDGIVILDTNVLLEPAKRVPSPVVLDWLRAQDRARLFATVISEVEIFYGVERLPAGKRRDALMTEAISTFEVRFAGRVLPFDESAARVYAHIVLSRQRAGRPIAQFDAMIAAIAQARSALLATRNAQDFEGCGIRVFDPFQFEALR